MLSKNIISRILDTGTTPQQPLADHQIIRFSNGVTLLFLTVMLIISIVLSKVFATPYIILRFSLIIVLLLSVFYWNKTGCTSFSRFTLGFIFPGLIFASQLFAKISLAHQSLGLFMYYLQGIFFLMLVVIPLNIYPKHKKIIPLNVAYILLLMIIQEPVNQLFGVGIEHVNHQKTYYILYIMFLLFAAAIFWIMVDFKEKEVTKYNKKYKVLNTNLNHLIRQRTLELEESYAFLKQLHLISISSSPPSKRILHILNECQKYLELDLAILATITPGETYIVSQVVTNKLGVVKGDSYHLKDTICEIIIRKKQSFDTPFVISPQQNTSYYTHTAFKNSSIKTYIGIPVLIDGKIYGTVNISGVQPGRKKFSEHEIASFRQATQAITNEIIKDQSSKKLLETEQNYYTLTQSVPVGVFRNNREGECIFVNARFCEITGLTFDECLGKGWIQALHPEDKTKVINAWKAFVHEDRSYNIHFRAVNKQEKITWLFAQAAKELDVKGNVIGFVGSVSDISEVVLSRQENERLILLAKSIDDMVIISNAQGQVEWINDSFSRHTGYTLEELKGKKPGSFLQGEETQLEYIQKLRDAIKNQVPVKVEIVNYTKYKKKFWVEIKLQPVFNEQGKLTNFIAIEKDITERKNFITRLSTNEEKFRNYLENAPFGVFVINRQGRQLEVNRAASKITGYSKEELLALNFATIHEKQYQNSLLKQLLRIPKSRNLNADYTFIKKDGVRAHWRVNVSLLSDNNLLVFTEDITHRLSIIIKLRSNEQKFRSYVKHAPHGMFVANMKGRYLEVNKLTTKLTGYGREELMNMTVFDFYEEGIREKVQAAFLELKQKGQIQVEFPYIKKGGSMAYWNISAVKLSQHKIIGFAQDITARKIQENKLVELSHTLEIQNEKLQFSLESGNLIAWEIDIRRNNMTFYPQHKETTFFERVFKTRTLDAFLQTIHEEQREAYKRKLDKHTQGNISFLEHDFKVSTTHNSWKWIHCQGKVIKQDMMGNPLTAYGIMQDINLKKNAEILVYQGQEKERKRVSREIHDSIGQMLFATRFLLNKVSKETNNHSTVQQIDSLLADMLLETRYIINNLGVSVFDNDNLYEAFYSFIKKMREISQSKIEFNWLGSHQVVDQTVSSNVFRIFQEALSNGIKYSNAMAITVAIENNGQLNMHIADDGVGFNMDQVALKEGFGLKNMKHRAKTINGKLAIVSHPNQGTQIDLSVG